MTVKLNLHDWPKRGAFERKDVEVEATDDTQAMQFGIQEGQRRWPHAKIKAYDVMRPRLLDSTAITSTLIGTEAPLEIKRRPGRPKKDAV